MRGANGVAIGLAGRHGAGHRREGWAATNAGHSVGGGGRVIDAAPIAHGAVAVERSPENLTFGGSRLGGTVLCVGGHVAVRRRAGGVDWAALTEQEVVTQACRVQLGPGPR